MNKSILLLALLLTLVACRQTAAPNNPNVVIRVTPDHLTVGITALIVEVSDADGTAIPDARIEVRGDMNHAGMQPVFGDAQPGDQPGEYRVPFEWTMGGDWIVTITVILPDDTRTEQSFEFVVES
ncbi:MAG: FixH family protein [Anaerolineae bacterium]|jgi:hypothetical protein|nr:FixH family protein [Anaerolineae bacterium]